MYKDLLLPMMSGRVPDPALQAARTLCKQWNARLTVLVGVSHAQPEPMAWEYFSGSLGSTMQECAETTVRAMAEAADARLREAGIEYEICRTSLSWATPAQMCMEHARLADVILLEADPPGALHPHRLFGELAASGGRPILSLPTGSGAIAMERALIAWNATREATRAIHDAIPWLQRMRAVEILVVEDGRFQAHAQDALICAHLRRHGVEAQIVRRSSSGGDAGQTIRVYAAESRTDLIVAGAYGHPRVMEMVFGGATRSLLANSPAPVFFSR